MIFLTFWILLLSCLNFHLSIFILVFSFILTIKVFIPHLIWHYLYFRPLFLPIFIVRIKFTLILFPYYYVHSVFLVLGACKIFSLQSTLSCISSACFLIVTAISGYSLKQGRTEGQHQSHELYVGNRVVKPCGGLWLYFRIRWMDSATKVWAGYTFFDQCCHFQDTL